MTDLRVKLDNLYRYMCPRVCVYVCVFIIIINNENNYVYDNGY